MISYLSASVCGLKKTFLDTFISTYFATSLAGKVVVGHYVPAYALPTWIGSLALGVAISASLIVLLLNQKNRQSHRRLVDDFAEDWLTMSNRLLPNRLQVDINLEVNPETGKPLPWKEQNSYLQTIRTRALSPASDAEYQAILNSLERLAERAFRNRADRYHFYLPLELYAETIQSFLSGCTDMNYLESERSVNLFNDFLCHQQDIRNGLLRRISRSYGSRFWNLNQAYDLNPQAELTWERKRLGLPERPKRQPAKIGRTRLELDRRKGGGRSLF